MTADTTAPSYWLNWRFLLCAIWILMAMVLSALVIWRYEGHNKSRSRPTGDQGEAARGSYKSEGWRTCSQSIHPIWLLAYRIVAFCALLALILADTIVHSVGIFYFYTQWTFTLVNFGLASSLSIHGHLLHRHEVDSEKDNLVGRDAEQGSYVEPTHGENSGMPSTNRSLNPGDDPKHRAASVWENALQIMFQMCAGAVVLTDAVFWLLIYPFLTGKDYRLSFLVVCMHSVNAVFLLGETILNSLRFPFFRIAYFVLWTSVFVVFQWIIHAFVSMRWPYPFLDLSSPYAPIW
ncbi:UNVERIFIED_CONTAM: hypothetical protein Sangu_1805000 [Sesamum angustifolium]|uniref:Uncharacterized protein n=1 Tax=Sesamum angustifolium TaxID=2727405 RepID=A0AAW2M787_9LAMI